MRDQKLKQLIINALFAVIIAILAQVTIPIGPIPLTGQTFAIGLAATILGARNATISVAVYLVLGAIGVPVFAGMSAGLGILFGPTGGFFDWFPVQCLCNRLPNRKNEFQHGLCYLRQHHRFLHYLTIWRALAKYWRRPLLERRIYCWRYSFHYSRHPKSNLCRPDWDQYSQAFSDCEIGLTF
ncbi:Biotin transporter BioY2 [Listeria grandensis FSL F6-0971]|uniref:Biotin transporter BioY2 n=1 Tax=Listeria grandensis FSL F6-0971 TaxID=1265819 RepID=W7BJV2_9LIST|nr:Biotin transporter BioY2 [Listeria grandensis FSL F6-0971]